MFRAIAARIIVASAALLTPAAASQEPSNPAASATSVVTMEEFGSLLKAGLSEFVVILPGDSQPLGEWSVDASITVGGETTFSRKAVIQTEDVTASFPMVAPYGAMAVRFVETPDIGWLMLDLEEQMAATRAQHEPGEGEVNVQLHAPNEFLSLESTAYCRGDKPLYFDIFIAGEALGEYRPVEIADGYRRALNGALLSRCGVLPVPTQNGQASSPEPT